MSKSIIRAQEIKYSYTVWENENESKRTALDDVSLDVRRGEFIGVLGRNGSGKSTFAKHLNALILPDSGTVWIDGKDTSEADKLRAIRDIVGMVFQNPDNQIIGTSVEEDVAFGPEQRNLPSDVIRRKVAESLDAVGLLGKRFASPFKLSGGQKQRLAIAGTLAADTDCIVLDEPTAMLDPASRREVIDILHQLHSVGKTIILITHHTDEVLGADRIFVMNKGYILASGAPEEIFAQPGLLTDAGLDMPRYTEAAYRLKEAGLGIRTPVLSEDDFAIQISNLLKSAKSEKDNPETADKRKIDSDRKPIDLTPIISMRDVHFAYNKGMINESKVLDGLDLDIYPGEFLGLAGTSGAGKTTLAKHLNGLLKADSGSVLYNGQNIYDKKFNLHQMRKEVGIVFQNPEQQLFCRTLIKDVCFGPRNMGMSEEEALEAARKSLDLVGIDSTYYELSPFEMSGGQMRRAAIAGILAMQPKVLILDEPAAGLDPASRDSMLDLLEKIRRENGTTIVLISHDMDDIAEHADRMIVLHDGMIAANGTPQEVFGDRRIVEQIGIGVPEIASAMSKVSELGIGLPKIPVKTDGAVELILKLAGNRIEGGDSHDA